MKNQVPEIDGLRAIAVAAVLIFHAFPGILRGGFIGVDIFFVISGYIITRTYFADLQSKKISLPHFYLRRIRRLAPVYIVVLLVATVAAYWLLGPLHLRNYGQSLFTQPMYLQNIVFWYEGDYFDNPYSKPLLHTWSLAVEEQFYITYAILILVARRSKKFVVPAVLLAMIISIVLAYMLSQSSPKTAFYWLPTRVWEFTIGILVALKLRNTYLHNPSLSNLLGLTVVVFSIVGYDEHAKFPGYQSILACLGTALILISCGGRNSHALLLGNRGLVYVGKLSYSLYLWHWPIIAIATTYLDRSLRFDEAVVALSLSFSLSYFSYKYIEKPIRERNAISDDRRLIILGGGSSLAIVGVAMILYATDGATYRYSPDVARLYKAQQERSPYRCPYFQRLVRFSSEICEMNKSDSNESILVLGDSHADQLDELIAKSAATEGMGTFLTKKNCPLHEYGNRSDCSVAVIRQIVNDIRANKIKGVFAISYLDRNFDKERELRKNVKELVSAGAYVYLVQVVPNNAYFDPEGRARALLKNEKLPLAYTKSEYYAENKVQIEALHRVATDINSVEVIDPAPYICPASKCDFDTAGQPNFIDSHHLSPTGAGRLAPMFSQMIRRVRMQDHHG